MYVLLFSSYYQGHNKSGIAKISTEGYKKLSLFFLENEWYFSNENRLTIIFLNSINQKSRSLNKYLDSCRLVGHAQNMNVYRKRSMLYDFRINNVNRLLYLNKYKFYYTNTNKFFEKCRTTVSHESLVSEAWRVCGRCAAQRLRLNTSTYMSTCTRILILYSNKIIFYVLMDLQIVLIIDSQLYI